MSRRSTLKSFDLFVLLLLLLLGLPLGVVAQSSAGGGAIQGTVKDATGSALPGAKITIRNLATGVDTSAAANSEGAFITPSLPIGRYRIRVE